MHSICPFLSLISNAQIFSGLKGSGEITGATMRLIILISQVGGLMQCHRIFLYLSDRFLRDIAVVYGLRLGSR